MDLHGERINKDNNNNNVGSNDNQGIDSGEEDEVNEINSDENVFSYKKYNKRRKNKKSHLISSLKSSFLYDVERFRDFYIKNHGRNGGWDELSHSMFEKIWKRIGPDNARFEQTCLESIPGLDFSSLQKHIKWYNNYLELLEKKKNAIEKWKLENKKRRIENQKNLNIYQNQIELDAKSKVDTEKKRKEDEERQKIKQKLKLWKEKKRLEEEKEILIAEEEKKKEKEIEDKKLQMKQKINKEKLKIYNEEKKKREYYKEKENNDNKKEIEVHIRGKKKIDLKYFQNKDKMFLKRRLQRKLKDQEEENQKEQRLEKIKSICTIEAERDPNRILQPTKTFQNYINSIYHHNKIKNLFSSVEDANAFFHPSNEIQHRAIPLWRKGIV